MPVKPIDYIVSAKHYGGSAEKYIKRQRERLHRRGIPILIHGFADPRGEPVLAEIWQGQWIARCECNGASFVDPEQPIFFCFSCINRANDFYCRPVVFPENWREIERVLLERPVNDIAGLTDLERAGMAKAVLYIEVDGTECPLVRSWKPGETISNLHAQQDNAIEKWRKEKHGI